MLQVSLQGLGVVAGAAVIANLFESYLGAALQGKALWMSNDIVNGIQICLAACVALVTTAYLYLESCICSAMTIVVHVARNVGYSQSQPCQMCIRSGLRSCYKSLRMYSTHAVQCHDIVHTLYKDVCQPGIHVCTIDVL